MTESIHSENQKNCLGKNQVNEMGECCIFLGEMPVSEFYPKGTDIHQLDVQSESHADGSRKDKKREELSEIQEYMKENKLHITSTCGHIMHLDCLGSWMKAGGKFCAICKKGYLRQDVPPGHEFDSIRNYFPVDHSNKRNEVVINILEVENFTRGPGRNSISSSIFISDSRIFTNIQRNAKMFFSLIFSFVFSIILCATVDHVFFIPPVIYTGLAILIFSRSLCSSEPPT